MSREPQRFHHALWVCTFMFLLGCVQHPSQDIEVTLCHSVGDTVQGRVGSYDVSLERVELVVAPLYGCASLMASRDNCTESVLEVLDPLLIDVPATEPHSVCTTAAARRVAMHSMMLDFGWYWPLGAGEAQQLLEGHPSLQLTGTAQKTGSDPLRFVIETNIQPANSGEQSLRIHRLNVALDPDKSLNIDWNMFSKLRFVDFERLEQESTNGFIHVKETNHQATVSVRNSILSGELEIK